MPRSPNADSGWDTNSHAITDQIVSDLYAAGNAERAVAEKRYLKSPLEFVGAGVPAVRASVGAVRRKYPALSRDIVLEVTDALWSRPVYECRLAAVEMLAAFIAALQPDDMQLVERLCREAGTWALVDPLAISIAGRLVERYPELTTTLDRWVTDQNFWVRRAALLSLLPPLRRGNGDAVRFLRYADMLLDEREFFIRKAIGWVLREMSKVQPELVATWLEPRARRASGITIREAVKYLAPAQRDAVLQARQGEPTASSSPA